jgi:hypothetical protein
VSETDPEVNAQAHRRVYVPTMSSWNRIGTTSSTKYVTSPRGKPLLTSGVNPHEALLMSKAIRSPPVHPLPKLRKMPG